MKDRYDNPLTTSSQSACNHYIAAVDLLLAGQTGFDLAFEQAIFADPGFALGHAGLARGRQSAGDIAGAKAAMAEARRLADNADPREQSHINTFGLLIDGKVAAAYSAIRSHVDAHPRDALVAQTCSSVFGLIGFSGQPGREAEILAFTAALLPHYGDDWWCQSQYAFALCENGALDRADTIIDKSLAANPNNAHGAHVRSHVYYEAGQTDLGIKYLGDWLQGYDRAAILHGHLSWHRALWLLEQCDLEAMWHRIDTDVGPTASLGLPINILTDTASILFRAELAGATVPKERWIEVGNFASEFFPKQLTDLPISTRLWPTPWRAISNCWKNSWPSQMS